MSALPSPTLASLLTAWAPQPIAIVVVVGAAAWYLSAVRRLPEAWPRWHSAAFAIGLLLLGWTTNGVLERYVDSLFWVWTTQYLALLLVVPVVIMAGQPIELARRVHGERSIRFVSSGLGRVFANPLVGPALIPVLSAVLFFGPLPGWAITTRPLAWVLEIVVVALGALIVLPLVGVSNQAGSLAVALALVIGVFELLLDAVPGIVLRLSTHPVTTFFDHRAVHSWSPTALHDQQLAGATLWVVAELIDLPFLLLIFRRWVRADARDAQEIDTVLDAERFARGVGDDELAPDAPWWLTDPAMRQRFER
ncbi:MAG: cytochrome c oxidase assembly protein [Actinobacteria bacterium]|nr:cytochrome c oxidase assembly protein [Actinomycetota bacterium]